MLFLALWLGLPFWIMTQTTNGWIIAGCVAWLFLCLIGAFAAIDDGEPIPLVPPAPPRPKPPLPKSKPKQGRMGQ